MKKMTENALRDAFSGESMASMKYLIFSDIAEKEGYFAEQKTDIHPQTLRAFVKERVENGDDFPMELFGAYVGQRAIIKRSK